MVAQGPLAGLVAFLQDLPRQVAAALSEDAAEAVASSVLNRLPAEVFVTVFRSRLSESLDRVGVLTRFRSLLDVLDDRALLGVLDELGLRLAARGVSGVGRIREVRDDLASRVFEEGGGWWQWASHVCRLRLPLCGREGRGARWPWPHPSRASPSVARIAARSGAKYERSGGPPCVRPLWRSGAGGGLRRWWR